MSLLNVIRTVKTPLITLLTSLLIACGGGSGGDESTTTTASESTTTITSTPITTTSTDTSSETPSTTTPPPIPGESPAEEEVIETPVEEIVEEVVAETPVEEVIAAITISWTAPSSRENDNPLELSEINGYEIHYYLLGPSQEEDVAFDPITVPPSATEYTISELTAGAYYVQMKTIDSDGTPSELSEPPIEAIIE